MAVRVTASDWQAVMLAVPVAWNRVDTAWYAVAVKGRGLVRVARRHTHQAAR